MSGDDDALSGRPPGSNPRARRTTQCAACGERIDQRAWHPVSTGTDDAGDFRVYAFCSRNCRSVFTEPADRNGTT